MVIYKIYQRIFPKKNIIITWILQVEIVGNYLIEINSIFKMKIINFARILDTSIFDTINFLNCRFRFFSLKSLFPEEDE